MSIECFQFCFCLSNKSSYKACFMSKIMPMPCLWAAVPVSHCPMQLHACLMEFAESCRMFKSYRQLGRQACQVKVARHTCHWVPHSCSFIHYLGGGYVCPVACPCLGGTSSPGERHEVHNAIATVACCCLTISSCSCPPCLRLQGWVG